MERLGHVLEPETLGGLGLDQRAHVLAHAAHRFGIADRLAGRPWRGVYRTPASSCGLLVLSSIGV
jgi:hypothetical protein